MAKKKPNKSKRVSGKSPTKSSVPTIAPPKPVSVLASVDTKAALYIPSDIYGQILGLCIGCDIEISWMGQLKPYYDGYIVTKIHVPKQECSAVETTMDADELAVLEYECEDGKYADYGELIWWGHSHVDMSTGWSGTDHEAKKQLAANGRVVATVFNRKFEFRTAYRQARSDDGFYPAVYSDNLKTVIIPTEETHKIIKGNVTREAVVPFTITGSDNYWDKHNRTNHYGDSYSRESTDKFYNEMYGKDTPPTEEDPHRDIHVDLIKSEFGTDTLLATTLYDDFLEENLAPPTGYQQLIAWVADNYTISTVGK